MFDESFHSFTRSNAVVADEAEAAGVAWSFGAISSRREFDADRGDTDDGLAFPFLAAAAAIRLFRKELWLPSETSSTKSAGFIPFGQRSPNKSKYASIDSKFRPSSPKYTISPL